MKKLLLTIGIVVSLFFVSSCVSVYGQTFGELGEKIFQGLTGKVTKETESCKKLEKLLKNDTMVMEDFDLKYIKLCEQVLHRDIDGIENN